ncbi:MAG: hypothetical protein IH913_12735, partial [Proteobacteria bacterium]|nr:hypothetical protein [Pseudomonadota bacterium]
MSYSIRFLPFHAAILTIIAPVASLAQWAEPDEGELIIRGGWLFDSVSDTRRRNSAII